MTLRASLVKGFLADISRVKTWEGAISMYFFTRTRSSLDILSKPLGFPASSINASTRAHSSKKIKGILEIRQNPLLFKQLILRIVFKLFLF